MKGLIIVEPFTTHHSLNKGWIASATPRNDTFSIIHFLSPLTRHFVPPSPSRGEEISELFNCSSFHLLNYFILDHSLLTIYFLKTGLRLLPLIGIGKLKEIFVFGASLNSYRDKVLFEFFDCVTVCHA